MDKKLPARPNLEHLRSQAKTLLSQLNSGDIQAAQTLIDHLPAARGTSVEQVQAAGYRLADAQSAIARKTGFTNWPRLAHHVEHLRQFEGEWEFVDLEVDGHTVPPGIIANSRMLMDGDRFRMESPEANYEGVFTIDVDQTPHQIDIEFVEGPEAGNWSYGIYEVEGDRFKLCLGIVGSTRPTAFTTAPGSGHALENLRRLSAGRPADVLGRERRSTASPAPTPLLADESEFELELTPLYRALEGEWKAVKVVNDGIPLPANWIAYGFRTVTGNEVKVAFGGQVMIHAKTRIDETQSPITVDYMSLHEAVRGQLSLGIMDWCGEEVKFCMAAPGEDRPSDFTCEPGSKRTLSQWKKG